LQIQHHTPCISAKLETVGVKPLFVDLGKLWYYHCCGGRCWRCRHAGAVGVAAQCGVSGGGFASKQKLQKLIGEKMRFTRRVRILFSNKPKQYNYYI